MTQEILFSGRDWQRLRSHLPSAAEFSATAFELGAFRQARGVPSAEALLRLALVYGAGPLSLSGTAAWAASAEIAKLSDVALLSRLRQAERWIGQIAGQLLPVQPPCGGAGLRHRLLAVDATTVKAPGAQSPPWRLHVSYDLVSGRIDHIEISDATGGEALARFPLRDGDIAICDAGYGHVPDIASARRQGADIVVAIAWNNIVLRQTDGQRLDILSHLRAAAPQQRVLDLPCIAVGARGTIECPVRLIATRRSPQSAERRKRRCRDAAHAKGRTLDDRTLEAAEWILLLTTLPAAATATDVLQLYRWRWQVELLFKRLKSLLDFGDLKAKDPHLVQTCLAAKIVAALLVDRLTQESLRTFPLGRRRRSPPPRALGDPKRDDPGHSLARPA